jgi:hypothetical protein
MRGRLLIAEEGAGRVRRLEPTGALAVLATGIKTPRWLAVAADGGLYVSAHRLLGPDGADVGEGRVILRLGPDGSLGVLAAGIRRLEGLTRLNGALVAATKGLASGPESAGKLLRYPVLADGTLGAPAEWVDTGLKQPVGLVLDALSAVYVSSKELTVESDAAKRAIGKVHPDARLTVFAEHLDDPQGVALGPDGSLYVADGKAGRVLRFRAPAPPVLDALPAFTKVTPLAVTGTTDPNARVDAFVDDAATGVSGLADSAGRFAVAVTLAANAPNALDVFGTTHAGDGLTGAPAAAAVTHDDLAPGLVLADPPGAGFVRQTVPVRAQASDGGSGVATLTLAAGGSPLAAALTPAPPAPEVTASASWDTIGEDGDRTIVATAVDRAGNTVSVSRTVVVDNIPPDTVITDGPGEATATSDVAFTFTGSDNRTAPADLGFAWRLDGGPWSAFGPATTVTLTGLAEGPHAFEVTARDLAGNEDPTPAAAGFTVAFGPVITTVDPASGPVGTYVTVTGQRFEPGATQAAVNGVPAVLQTVTATTLTTTVPIGATSGDLTVTTPRGTARRPFTVPTTGDFTLAAAPATVRAIAGDQASVSVAVGGSGSFTSLVSVSVSSAEPGLTTSLGSPVVAPGATTFVSVSVASTVAPGTYVVTATGDAQIDGRTQTRTASFALEVLPPETAAVTGRVLTAEAVPQPIPGVTVTLGSAFTLTDAAGNFVLLAPPAGANMLGVDGRTASTPAAQYPPVEVNLTVAPTGPTRVPFVVYLPAPSTRPTR